MLRKAKSPRNKGFTLIELLVVISIISLLSTIVLASLNTAREKAKDAATTANLKSLTLAMELYKSDTGFYPGQNNSFIGCNGGYCDYYNGYLGPTDAEFITLQQSLSSYISSIDFIKSNFLVDYQYSGYYIYDIQAILGSTNSYSCDGTKTFTDYVLALPIYDASGRLTNLPFPIDTNDGLVGANYYCIGV